MQTPVMKPTITLLETNLVTQPSLRRPNASWMSPTIRVSMISTPVRSSAPVLPTASPTARAMAPVVVTVMKTEPANRAPIGVPMTSVLRPLTGLTAARIAEAMASGICTRPVVRPAMRSLLTSPPLGRLMGDFTQRLLWRPPRPHSALHNRRPTSLAAHNRGSPRYTG